MKNPKVIITEQHLSHPERQKDEIFLTNSAGLRTNYRTVRYGRIAYDINGKPVNGLHPVFVEIWEYVKTQMNYAKGIY